MQIKTTKLNLESNIISALKSGHITFTKLQQIATILELDDITSISIDKPDSDTICMSVPERLPVQAVQDYKKSSQAKKKKTSQDKIKKAKQVRKPNAYNVFIKQYRIDNPNKTHAEAREAYKLHKSSTQTTTNQKVKKIKKKQTIHKCIYCCEFESKHKSNLNRHIKKHFDHTKLESRKAYLYGQIGKAKTSHKKLKFKLARAEHAVNINRKNQKHIDLVEKFTKLIEIERNRHNRCIELLKNEPQNVKNPEKKPKKTVNKPDTETRAMSLLNVHVINQMNKFYSLSYPDDDNDLNFNLQHIESASIDDNANITARLTNFAINGKNVDIMKLISTDDGYTVKMMKIITCNGRKLGSPVARFGLRV